MLDIIAVECDGMSGASLAGVARAAASRALERAVTDFAGSISNELPTNEGNSMYDCLVTQEDFERAIEDVFESSKSADYVEDEGAGNTDDESEDSDASTTNVDASK